MPTSKTTSLRDHLALHRFICAEFGYAGLDGMLERLRPARGELGASGGSDYALALAPLPAQARVAVDQLAEYDANITAHSRRLRIAGEHGRTWKPHQYLALLFSEHYLFRYFDDGEALLRDLNAARRQQRETLAMPEYTQNDLRVLAFQSATGSGKTLLMHAHILQYQHYLHRAGERLNNVVLLTPNEQMSAQHERELRTSGLHARRFSSDAGTDLLRPVEIIDLNKLAEKKGVKRVAVKEFGDNNLVLVDEGHLGTSGKRKVWRERRKELSEGGFTFEYSATFNQVVGKDPDLLHAYGKCLLFDYTYRRFYDDGYGKDYAISNLPGGAEDQNSNLYLLGCLLTFYQQFRIWRSRAADWREFNPSKPLWVFLGKTVKGSSEADRATRSDVVRILSFLGWVLAHGDAVRSMLARLLEGKSGLLDEAGTDYFADRFGHLPHSGIDLYADLCDLLFHGQGRLHIVYLTAGQGELHLRVADQAPFGVVNVGDSAALYKLLTENAGGDFVVDREQGFAARLFADVDRQDSTVNIVIGARRFIAGWNSWRVSTMGLMHVGVSEGPEIIQMFGRGVRLQGWNLSLKRHRESEAEPPPDSAALQELETLYIFGLRANYMQTFRDLLQAEGMRVDRETITLPVTWNFARQKNLKLIRLKEGVKYGHSTDRPVLPNPEDASMSSVVEVDLYSRLQAVTSNKDVSSGDTGRLSVKLDPRHVALFDRTRIRDKLTKHKQRVGWHNLVIRPKTVDRLLENDRWYVLHAPPERMQVKGIRDLHALEAIAVDLLVEYAAGFWRRRRRQWEHERIEVVTLDEDDPNKISEYRLSIDAAETRLVEDLRDLKRTFQDEGHHHHLKLGVLQINSHAYFPLLYADKGCKVTIQPVALDRNEKKAVEALDALAKRADPCLRGRELYLIRNQTRRRGISFFDGYMYYPDFIIWLVNDESQHVIFLDPKGLVRYGPKEREKVKLHADIKLVQNRIQVSDPALHLHAYVLSVTSADEIGDELVPPEEWNDRGVYFLDDPDCLKRVLESALAG